MRALGGWFALARGSLHVRFGAALIALPLCACAPWTARGENDQTNLLRQEVIDLKQVVQHLNEHVEGLEKQIAPASKSGPQAAAAPATPVAQPPATAKPGESIRDHWRQIDHGMTAPAVEALIGHPQRTMTVDLKTVWYYTYPEVGSGSIVFARDGSVDDWRTPPFNTWW